MARLPTNIVAGQAGHVAHSNQAYEMLDQLRHSGGSRMINVTDPPAAVSAVAAVGDGVTDDNVALQTIFDWLQTQTGNFWVYFPNQTYMTSKPLRVWSGTRIEGPAQIRAHASFDWTNHPYWEHARYKPVGNPQPGDIALVELWNESTSGRGGSSRIFIHDLILNCLDQPGSLGLLTHMQQPAYTWKLRIDRCAKAGWALWGQQSDHFIAEILDCPVGLYLGPNIGGLGTFGASGSTCKFVSFYTLNVEGYATAAIRMDCDGPNWFYNCHFESLQSLGGPGKNVIDCMEGGFSFHNGWATHNGDTNHVFSIGNKTPLPGHHKTTYNIENFRLAQPNSTGQLMINDLVRGFSRAVGLHRVVGSFRTLWQNDSQIDYDAGIEYLGDDGGTVRIGGIRGGTAAPAGHSGAQLTVRANTGQDEPAVRFGPSDGTLRAGVHQTGNLFLASYSNATRPAASTLLAGTMIWNTDDIAVNFSDGAAWRDAMGTAT